MMTRLSASSAGFLAALIGDVGRGRRALEQRSALAVVAGRICSTALARRSQLALSSGATTVIWPSNCKPVRKSLRAKAASASRRSSGGGLGDLAGFALDLRFELDRRVGEIVALEGLVGGDGGDNRKTTSARNGSADEREHGETSLPVGRDNPSGGGAR